MKLNYQYLNITLHVHVCICWLNIGVNFLFLYLVIQAFLFFLVVSISEIKTKAVLNDSNYSAAHICLRSCWQWLSLCENDSDLCCP